MLFFNRSRYAKMYSKSRHESGRNSSVSFGKFTYTEEITKLLCLTEEMVNQGGREGVGVLCPFGFPTTGSMALP